MTETKKKPTVKLIGEDGNAFYILGTCVRAARKAGWTQAEIDALVDELKAGDYDNLLRVALTRFTVR